MFCFTFHPSSCIDIDEDQIKIQEVPERAQYESTYN